MPDSHPDTEAGRWLTYRQIGDLRRISKASAERLVRRHRWRRQEDNQGVTRALVPPEWTNPVPDRATDRPPDIRGDGAPDVTPAAAAFGVALSAVREAKDGEIAALRQTIEAMHGERVASHAMHDALRERLEQTEARAARTEAMSGELHAKLAAARAELDAASERADRADEELRLAREALDQAERITAERRARGVLARLRAAVRGE